MASATKCSYRPDLQGIRALSIVFVVLNHAGSRFFSGGFVGVDVFFVLSGYLITGLLVQEHIDSGRINLLNFFARRLKRLLPALFVMLSVIVLCGSLLLSDYQLAQQTASVNFAATWSSNLFFSLTTIEYFSELKNKDLFLHTWSLGVEEQFYLLWPVLIAISFALIKKMQGRMSWQLRFIAFIALIFLCSFGMSQYWRIVNPIFSFYMMPSRIWQFSLGAVAFVWFDKNKHDFELSNPRYLPSLWKEGFGFIGIGLILVSVVFFHSNMTYPGAWALLPSIGALLLISAGYINKKNVTTRVLSHPSLVWVGDRSYSWYLWHWPILMLGFSAGMRPELGSGTGLIALSFLIAIFSYRYIELPFWKGRFSNARPLLIVLLSTLFMLVLVCGCHSYLKSVNDRSDVQSISLVSKARADLPVIYSQHCDAWYANADVHPCVFGDANAEKTVVLIGDSIGAQWYSLLPGIFLSPEWRIVVLTKSSCPMVDEDFFYRRIGKIYTVCNEWRNAVINYLATIHPDIIFVGNSAVNDFSEEQWVGGSARVFARLSGIAKNVIVLPGSYALTFDGPSCLERDLSSLLSNVENKSRVCEERASTAGQVNKVIGYLTHAASGLPNVGLLNLNDLVCPNGQCSALNSDGLIVFRDSQHLTDTFVRRQVPRVRDRLKRMGIVLSSNP